MDKHIVFVMGSYVPEMSANVKCIENVVNVLKEKNYRITVVCATQCGTKQDEIKNVKVHRIQFINYASRLSSCKSKVMKYFLVFGHFIKSVFLLPIYPNVTPSISYKIYKKLVDIQTDEGIDCVISVFQPYFPISAALKFKKKFKDVLIIGYYLDVMKGANKPFGVTQSIFEKLCDKSQNNDFSKLDTIFLPECSKVYYDILDFSKYKEKITYLNFPTLLWKNYTGDTLANSLNMVYAGTTDNLYRNPKRAIEIFLKLKKHYTNLVFHLYGPSNMRDELKQLEKNSDGGFVYHGVVRKEDADLAVQNADYCVNFGNNVLGMVPSKVFELISTGKSIIHFTPGLTDSSVVYMKKYPKAYIVKYEKSDDEILVELRANLNKEKKNIDFDTIERLFYSATPEAVANEIVEKIAKEEFYE